MFCDFETMFVEYLYVPSPAKPDEPFVTGLIHEALKSVKFTSFFPLEMTGESFLLLLEGFAELDDELLPLSLI